MDPARRDSAVSLEVDVGRSAVVAVFVRPGLSTSGLVGTLPEGALPA